MTITSVCDVANDMKWDGNMAKIYLKLDRFVFDYRVITS